MVFFSFILLFQDENGILEIVEISSTAFREYLYIIYGGKAGRLTEEVKKEMDSFIHHHSLMTIEELQKRTIHFKPLWNKKKLSGFFPPLCNTFFIPFRL